MAHRLGHRGKGLGAGVLLLVAVASGPVWGASDAPKGEAARDLVAAMMQHEMSAGGNKDKYEYLSKERSDRTGGHLWTEHVVETSAGKLRMLLEEDGKPLSADRVAAERGRLAAIVADPDGFAKREQALKNDESHSRQMLMLLPRAFLFSDPKTEGEFLRIDFKPNPDYQTQSMEEKVLHGMSGSMLIEPKELRLHRIDGRLDADVSLGFGILATVKAGSNFGTTRSPIGGPEWKTTLIDTDIDGKAMFFKAIAKKEHAEHGEFVRVPNDLSVVQGVELVER